MRAYSPVIFWLRLLAAAGCVTLFSAADGADGADATHGTDAAAGAAMEINTLPAGMAAEIDASVKEVMEHAGVPGVSIAVVREGKIAYLRAYGNARVAQDKDGKDLPATTETRYGIGSVSKQFTAAAILLLAQEGKLTLDDPVGRYVPKLTHGDKITIRQVLSHTSGYPDYWPQDYLFPDALKPVTPAAILDRWARVPLDFEPGADWQYSNTNYTIAGLIVEKVSGMPLMDFLQKRIFEPLHMSRVEECDTKPLAAPDAASYTRVAGGPLRPAAKEGRGWLFAMGQLVMTPRELAVWNISIIDKSLLTAKSYGEMTRGVTLADGRSPGYGLGVEVQDDNGRRMIAHDGEISGMLTVNRVWPEQRAALVVMMNVDGTLAQFTLADRIGEVLLPSARGVDEEVRGIFADLQQGKIDASKLSENARAYFTPQALEDAAKGLSALGPLRALKLEGEIGRGGMTFRMYTAECGQGTATISVFLLKNGKFEQFMVLSKGK